MGLILDTSVLIAAERKKLDLEGFVQSLSGEAFFMASITLSELWHGCHRGTGCALQERLKHVKHLEATIPVLEFGANEALVHAKIWAGLEKIGQGIGLHDLIIGATALANECDLATLNEKEFKRIPNLRLVSVTQFRVK